MSNKFVENRKDADEKWPEEPSGLTNREVRDAMDAAEKGDRWACFTLGCLVGIMIGIAATLLAQ